MWQWIRDEVPLNALKIQSLSTLVLRVHHLRLVTARMLLVALKE